MKTLILKRKLMLRLQGSVSIFTGCRVHETASLILLKYVLGSANLGLNTSKVAATSQVINAQTANLPIL